MSSRSDGVCRFGVFEFDLKNLELRRNGVKLKLQDQPRRVLVQLLEHQGELVSRETLRSLLWPDDTFVDFETGLNTAVKRLRETIGDSADNPTFIETVPRKGYRFIAGVEVVARNGNKPPAVAPSVKRRGKNALAIAFISLTVLLSVAGVITWRSLPRAPRVINVVQVTNDGKAKIPMNLFVTDGVHLYFMEGTPWAGGSAIVQVSERGGETTHVATPLKEILAISGISPDFSQLLVANGVAVQADRDSGRSAGAAEIWVQPLPAGTPHRVGKIYATDAIFTPDGMHIVYSDGTALIVINTDGSDPHELAKVQGMVRGMRYSPDGKRIRFYIQSSSGEFDAGSLWQIDANGDNLHALLPNWRESPTQCCGNWSSDGNYYFQAGHGNTQAIWVMPQHRFAGGTVSPSRLISGPLQLSAPVPSADGKRLFVVGTESRVEPVRYDSKLHRYESYLNGISTSSFEISPDRKWIAYVSYPDMSLWRSRMDGSEKMQLTFSPVRAHSPRWSPDGSQIVFSDVRFNGPWTVGLISSSGGLPQFFPGGDPNWLPDGRSIICMRTKPDDKAPFAGIFKVDLATGKASSIPNSEGLYSPRASPDGRYIAAFSQAATEVLLFDSKTNRWSRLAKGELFAYNLWSPDGKYVYMRDNHSGAPRIVRVRIRDAKLEEVLSLKDLPQVVDVFTGWIGLTPEGEPVVIRDRSTQEIYALSLQ